MGFGQSGGCVENTVSRTLRLDITHPKGDMGCVLDSGQK